MWWTARKMGTLAFMWKANKTSAYGQAARPVHAPAS